MELVKQELCESGVHPSQFIAINFEAMRYSHLQTAMALHDEITARAVEMEGKVYLFFDEIQEVKDWEKWVNSLRVSLDCDIYITGSNAKLLSGGIPYLANLRFADEPSKQYLHDLFNSVQLKDIVQRKKSVM